MSPLNQQMTHNASIMHLCNYAMPFARNNKNNHFDLLLVHDGDYGDEMHLEDTTYHDTDCGIIHIINHQYNSYVHMTLNDYR